MVYDSGVILLGVILYINIHVTLDTSQTQPKQAMCSVWLHLSCDYCESKYS